jgi:protein-S-isoprenylcysteine O-methyltransferase Ste14
MQFASTNPWCLFPAILATAAWSGIYVLRALTEERHLGSDPDYQAYRSRVRWRFVPGLV